MLERKAPESKIRFALLLDRARVRVVAEPDEAAPAQAMAVTVTTPAAQVLAEGLTVEVDYFVTLDGGHSVENPRTGKLSFVVGTPGDFLAWLRDRLRGG